MKINLTVDLTRSKDAIGMERSADSNVLYYDIYAQDAEGNPVVLSMHTEGFEDELAPTIIELVRRASMVLSGWDIGEDPEMYEPEAIEATANPRPGVVIGWDLLSGPGNEPVQNMLTIIQR